MARVVFVEGMIHSLYSLAFSQYLIDHKEIKFKLRSHFHRYWYPLRDSKKIFVTQTMLAWAIKRHLMFACTHLVRSLGYFLDCLCVSLVRLAQVSASPIEFILLSLKRH
jgi:hypothetical protein